MPRAPRHVDAIVVGAGIVGLATARALVRRRPGLEVLVLDKEAEIAAHQTGHNSGVVHSGVYYRPGTLKSRLVADGRRELVSLCRERDLRIERCGKVIVATSEEEVGRLSELRARAASQGIETELVGAAGLRRLEPHAGGIGALHVPGAAIVDFAEVARALASDLAAHGEVRLDTAAHRVDAAGSGVSVATSSGTWRARVAVNCAGLHADVLARRSGVRSDTRIIPFRGEYHDLVPHRRHLVRGLVYPVPDPRLPFLGVHLTRMVDGRVHAGPNAVLALAREGYSWRHIETSEIRGLAAAPAMRRLAARHWRTGAGEVARSLSTGLMVRSLRRLVPEIGPDDLVRASAGVRAQAVGPDGTLVDDFVIERTGRVVHVLNAPSPAATAALAIGDHIAASLDDLTPRAW